MTLFTVAIVVCLEDDEGVLDERDQGDRVEDEWQKPQNVFAVLDPFSEGARIHVERWSPNVP